MNIRPYRQILPQLAKRVYVDPTATVIGDAHLGEDSSVWPYVLIRGDVNNIRIGARTNIQDHSVFHVTRASLQHPDGFAVNVGDDVTIGHRVTLHGCDVHDRCLIGINVVILDGAVVESEVLVGAGSLVPPGKRLTSGYLWLGNPVQQRRPLTDAERAYFLESAENYCRLKDEYL